MLIIHEHCGVLCTHTDTHNHPYCDKAKRLAKRGWLLLYPSAVVYWYCCLYSVHCSRCGAASLKSSCPAHCVVRRSPSTADYGRTQNSYCKTNTRHVDRPNPHLHRSVYRPPPCVHRRRKLLLLLLLCCCNVRVRNMCKTGVDWILYRSAM